MKTKNIIALILAILMMATLFTGCGKGDDPEDTNPSETEQTEAPTEETEPPIPEQAAFLIISNVEIAKNKQLIGGKAIKGLHVGDVLQYREDLQVGSNKFVVEYLEIDQTPVTEVKHNDRCRIIISAKDSDIITNERIEVIKENKNTISLKDATDALKGLKEEILKQEEQVNKDRASATINDVQYDMEMEEEQCFTLSITTHGVIHNGDTIILTKTDGTEVKETIDSMFLKEGTEEIVINGIPEADNQTVFIQINTQQINEGEIDASKGIQTPKIDLWEKETNRIAYPVFHKTGEELSDRVSSVMTTNDKAMNVRMLQSTVLIPTEKTIFTMIDNKYLYAVGYDDSDESIENKINSLFSSAPPTASLLPKENPTYQKFLEKKKIEINGDTGWEYRGKYDTDIIRGTIIAVVMEVDGHTVISAVATDTNQQITEKSIRECYNSLVTVNFQ